MIFNHAHGSEEIEHVYLDKYIYLYTIVLAMCIIKHAKLAVLKGWATAISKLKL